MEILPAPTYVRIGLLDGRPFQDEGSYVLQEVTFVLIFRQ